MKNQEILKMRFASLMRKYTKRNKVRQVHLANMLDVTPSAISQMFDCNIAMGLSQLSLIARALKINDDELFELQALLNKIRNGDVTVRSPFNKLMKKLRRSNHYSIAQLSALTGIGRVVLKAYEDNFAVTIRPQDAEILANLYKCEVSDLIKNAIIANDDENGETYDNPNVEYTSVAEAQKGYKQEIQVPILNIDELTVFSTNAGLVNFADARSIDMLPNRTYDCEVVAVIANNEKLNMILPGKTILILKEYDAKDHSANVFLGLDKKGDYIIFSKKKSDIATLLTTKETETVASKIKWQLPIVEIIIQPNDK